MVNIDKSTGLPTTTGEGNTVVLEGLPTTGGTMTGTLYVANNNSIMQVADNGVLRIYGGSDDAAPAVMLFGKKQGTYSGYAYLRASNGEQSVVLALRPNGQLLLGGKDVTLGYPNYASPTAATANTYTASADGWVSAARSASTNLLIKVGGKDVLSDVSSVIFPVKKGDVVTFFNTGTSTAASAKITFFPNR